MSETLNTVSWDLTGLYASVSDPAIEADMRAATERVGVFRKRYHGRIGSDDLTPEFLRDAVREIEALQESALKPYLYAQLLFSADTGDDAHKALVQKTREFLTRLRHEILFFELEILAIPEERFVSLLAAETLAAYRHYLQRLRLFRPYTLSEKEEQVINIKDLTGKQAFGQLFEELTSSFRYRLEIAGEEREYTGEELLAMLHRPEADLRERAFSRFLERHGEHALVLGAAFNNIFLDHGEECRLRGYPDPVAPTHLANELSRETIGRMMDVTEEHYPLAQHYFSLKARMLGLPRLKNSDIYAPVTGEVRKIPFDEARETVLSAYRGFSPEVEAIGRGFFTESRIDAAPRPGKTGGAFCSGMTPALPSYVLLNYTGTLRDLATLAHELGHGIHFTLSKKQTLVNYDAVLPMAETASVFGEMVLTRHLLEREEDPRIRTSLLCAKIEDIIATTFRQNMLTRFEMEAHRLRSERLLGPEDLCALWWEENRKLFGEAVEMIPAYKWGWSYISHFIHARFYCYSYVFGELLVLSLFQRYREEGAGFVPRYLALLSAGGSDSPPNLLSGILGIDIADPEFWRKGYDVLRELIGDLERTLASQSS